jgi:hypothetical protein
MATSEFQKRAKFHVSLAYNRALARFPQGQRALWNEIVDLDGHSTRIILGQLPSPTWSRKDSFGRWTKTSFGDFVDEHRIRGVLAVVEQFEWDFAGVQQLLYEREVRVSMQSIADFSGADPDKLQDSVRFIEEVLRSSPDARVYVHCKAGRGRSAAAIMAYLATPHADLRPAGPLDLATAHFVVRQSRSHIKVGLHKLRDLQEYYVRQILGWETPAWSEEEAVCAIQVLKQARRSVWRSRNAESPEFTRLRDLYVTMLHDVSLHRSSSVQDVLLDYLCLPELAQVDKRYRFCTVGM